MASVSLWGASYSDVPAITVPSPGGGAVTFYEDGGGGVEEITVPDSGSVSQTLQPNKVYHFTSTALTSLTITLAQSTGQYHFDFISPATAVALTLPSDVEMPPSFGVESNTKYEIDILDNVGVAAEWVYEVV